MYLVMAGGFNYVQMKKFFAAAAKNNVSHRAAIEHFTMPISHIVSIEGNSLTNSLRSC